MHINYEGLDKEHQLLIDPVLAMIENVLEIEYLVFIGDPDDVEEPRFQALYNLALLDDPNVLSLTMRGWRAGCYFLPGKFVEVTYRSESGHSFKYLFVNESRWITGG